ncbi:agamous-like MADS-box protein AGL62 [Coffea eugenioides]|uniref:agamous-like MADS-box protein AGL62 n=1 Tax=Coffea eugenioides TaxID=49369 RepID=UPI000F60AEB7|nr:agamous-like MADS-box protein AGL62 [Coffea eugenioides]
MAKKLTKGRQKVPIVKMETMSHLQVTFSKRRNGLFKKASELCTLTEAEIALVVFSPGQKAYSFGHLSFESVVDKYLGRNPTPSIHGSIDRYAVANYQEDISELNNKLTALEKLLEAEKRRGEVFDQMAKEAQQKYWWRVPIKELNLEELQKLEKALQGLKKKIENELHKSPIEAINIPQYLIGQSNSGRNIGLSNGVGVPYGNRASDPNGFSLFGAIARDNVGTTSSNAMAPVIGDSNMSHGNNSNHFYKFL